MDGVCSNEQPSYLPCATVMDDHSTSSSIGLSRFIAHYHRFALLCGGALLGLAWSRIISVASREHFMRSVLLLGALSVLFVVYQRRQNSRHERWPLAWVALCLYFGALTVWNEIYFEHIAHTGFATDVFRASLRTFQAPVYGVAKSITVAGLATATAFTALFCVVLRWALAHAEQTRRLALAFMLLQLLAIVGLTLCNGHGQWPDSHLIHGGFDAELAAFSTPSAMWSEWNTHMAQFQTRASHYPPGPMFVALLEHRYHLPGLWMACSVLAILLCIPLLLDLCANLGLAPVIGISAVSWQLASAAFMSFTPIANAAPTAFLTLALLAALGRALRGQWYFALLGGLVLGCHGLYSFTAVFATLLALVWLLAAALTGVVDRARALQCIALLLLGSTGLWLLVYGVTDFNLAACFDIALSNNRDAMSHELFEVPSRYLLRSSGNLLAYGAYLGPLAGLYALVGTWRAQFAGRAISAFACAPVTTLLVAGFSGSFFLETERVWMFFTPAVAIVAGFGLSGLRRDNTLASHHGLTLVASVLLGWTLALGMHQQMPPAEQIDAAAWQRARILLQPASAPKVPDPHRAE